MGIDTDIAKYGGWGVAVAAIIALAYLVVKMLDFMKDNNKLFTNSVDANTKATLEMHEFLKNLNGRLAQAVKDKLNEK